jgi:NADH dehydrogenase
MEGVNKIGEGWLSWSAGSKSGWMFSKGVVQAGIAKAAEAGTAVADATSAASEEWVEEGAAAVEPVVEAIAAASEEWVEGGAEVVAAAGSAVADAANTAGVAFGKVWDLTKPIFDFNGGISTWFRQTFMDGMASALPFQFFQLMIVGVEIAIGLALMGGLFTWWAAVISIVMCVVFTVSGMFAWDQLWFIFAGILMMGGAGRAFGLDCWVVPFCKKIWNGTKIARRNFWYLDGPSKK